MGRRRSRRRRRSPDEINPGHTKIRSVLRVVGPGLILLGAILAISGFTMETEPETPFFTDSAKHFRESKELQGKQLARIVPGMLCLMLGIAASRFAFVGALARYHAAEYAPVVTDTANYVARGARQGIREVSSAIADGIRGEGGAKCPNCGTDNDSDASFCDSCGTSMNNEVECASCGEENDADAKFCKACGKPLG